MTFLATGIMIASLTVSSIDSPVTYDEIVDEATYNCKNANWEKVDRKFLWTLVDIEKKHGVPASMRGMILSSACMESGYNRHARGDWRTVKRRGKNVRVSKALGIFQMWPWWERSYKIDRTDVKQSADAYLAHIKRQISKVKRKCKIRSEKKVWVTAWVTAIRAPSKNGRCHQKPKHYRLLRKWYRNIKRDRKSADECQENGIDGCGC